MEGTIEMNSHHRFRMGAIGAALACLAATAAQAAPITLTGDLTGNLAGGAHTGLFDGSALLPANFQINSASFSFLFSDDQDGFSTGTPQATGSSAGGYTQTYNSYTNGNYYYTAVRSLTAYQQVQRTGEQESVSVSLAGTGVGSGATAQSQSSSSSSSYVGLVYDYQSGYNGYSYTYGCGNRSTCGGWQSGSWTSYYNDTTNNLTTNTSDWGGDFEVAGTVSDLSLLDSLLASRELQYELLVAGDLRLIGATLTLDVTELEPLAANAVPEPGSLALALGALGGLAYRSRRRSTASA